MIELTPPVFVLKGQVLLLKLKINMKLAGDGK
jgi:hypothetical protein